MPDYRYLCMTSKGQYVRGEYTAIDKEDLVVRLWEHHLFLVTWDEMDPAEDTGQKRDVIAPHPVHHEQVEGIWHQFGRNPGRLLIGASEKTGGTPSEIAAIGDAYPVGSDNEKRVERSAIGVRKAQWAAGILALGILIGPTLGHYAQVLSWRIRFHRAGREMQTIVDAAKADRAQHPDYAPQVMPGLSPQRLEKYLKAWPKPPCPGWVYGWDNWRGVPGSEETIRVTLRDPNLYAVFYLCVDSSASCAPPFMWGRGTAMDHAVRPYLTCGER